MFVSPSGESLLVDTGFPGERDAGRIMEAVKAAGLTQIDHLLSTHYHLDHIGHVVPLASMIPIKNFYDHGPTAEPDREQVPGFQKAYAEIHAKAKHTVLKPGDKIPFAGVDLARRHFRRCSRSRRRSKVRRRRAPNPACATFQPKNTTADPETAIRSAASSHSGGRTTTWAISCGTRVRSDVPTNRIGTIDLTSPRTTARPVRIGSAGAPVAQPGSIVNNGIRKGGSAEAFRVLETAPGLEDIWQLHWSAPAGIEHNAPGVFIANVEDNAAVGDDSNRAATTAGRGARRGAAPQTRALPAGAALHRR